MLSHSSFRREGYIPGGESLLAESSVYQLSMDEDQNAINVGSEQMVGGCPRPLMQERRMKAHGDPILKCPRCDSLNTKFCYYNNYSLTQPRHFCKNCKRYWTKGGALRNVPIGGGCRKNKRIKQRGSDQGGGGSASSVTADDPAHMRGGDGSSSSSPLRHDFSRSAGAGATSSPGVYPTPGLYGTDEGERLGLAFERLDQTSSRAFSVSSAPISVQWAPAQELPSAAPPPSENLHPFDSSILALTLTGHLNHNTNKRLHNGEFTSLLSAPPSSSLNDHNLSSPYNFSPLEAGYGVPSTVNADLLQWRLPPRLVTLAEDHASKGKLLSAPDQSIMPISSEIDAADHHQTSSSDWPLPADGFFEAMGDTGSYWAGGSWPADMAMYGNISGSQLL